MKKLVLILSVMILSFVAMSQNKPVEVAPDAYLTDATYSYVWGTASDTLTNAGTLSFIYRVKGIESPDLTVKLYNDWVSGSAGGVLTAYYSIDGVNYTAVDTTITVTTLTADELDTETISITDFMYPYLKFEYIQSGTAVTVPKLYLYAKFN